MAEMVVSAVVTVLIEKLLAGDFMKFARSQGIDSQLRNWNTTLPMIQAVLADAAQKQITQKLVELWMVELQDLVYDIEDVLDDMATEVMKRNLQQSDGSTSSSKVLNMIPTTCCTSSYTSHNIKYGRKISSKLDEITTRLHDLFELSVSLGLNRHGETSSRTNKRLEETSLLPDVSDILGRQGDKEALLGKLLGDEGASNNQNVSIVSIVGMGGIGKTTLARLLYNDPKVKDHFKPRAWVCVSDEFDVFNVSKAIYQAVCGKNKEFSNLDLLHVDLKEKLSNKRFLLVLDDVWNEDHKKWEVLKQPLVGAPGSKVIVTTRNTMVASVMNSVQPHNLGVLSDNIALSLFAQYALEEQNFDKHRSLKPIAQDIVKKCDGLPLALVTIGRVLKTKGIDVVEWEALLNSEIWSSEDDGSGILPALKLSYYHLPSHLKQLFAYCSLYPKDHQFDKNKLVLKWMAQGFLSQTRGAKSMEILGHGYFEELRLRCFFQPSTIDKSRYTMHDLMNDLAISVAGKFFFMLDDKVETNGQNEDFEKLRHFSFIGERSPDYRKLKELYRARCLRTFLPIGGRFNRLDDVLVKSLTRLQFLRVLSLARSSITEVPQSIGNFKHLRYLNFSSTRIKNLPKQVGKLYNLQSLLVRDCRRLSSLPISLVKLKNLRHLDMAGTPLLVKTPLVIGGLTSLQALSKVFIESGNGFKISKLKGLSDLQGALSIKGLHKVIHPTEANDANLQQKKGLDDLDLEWSDAFDAFRNPTIEYDVLEKLTPPSKLKKLTISFYGGIKFPSWLGNPTSFDWLSDLTLRGCENCTNLPTLGHLSSLQKLRLSSMKAVKTVGFELLTSTKPFYGNAFPSLEYLEVDDMQCLEIWWTSGGDDEEPPQSFPSLRVISFIGCPRLGKVSFGLMPSLESLKVHDMQSLEIWSTSGGDDLKNPQSFPRLRIISFTGCPKLGKLSFGLMLSLESLKVHDMQSLEIWSTNGGDDVETPQSIPNLRAISIKRCLKLVKVTCGLIPSLKELTIEECSEAVLRDLVGVSSSIRTLKLDAIKGLTQLDIEVLKNLGAVEDLSIKGCHELRYLWESELEACRFLGNLQNLKVNLCEKLGSIDKGKKEAVKVGSSIMRSLRQVTLCDCHSLESYCCPNNVEKLDIRNCSSMTSLSFSKLKNLEVSHCKNLKSIGEKEVVNVGSMTLRDCHSLVRYCCPSNVEKLDIRNCSSMTSLSFSNLKILEVSHCKNLKSIGEKEGVNVESGITGSLRQVRLSDCHSLESYSCPNSVEWVAIRNCSSMTSLSFSKLLEDLPSSSSSSSSSFNLKILEFGHCKNIKSISQKLLQSLTSLEGMIVVDCPSMEDSFPWLWPPNLKRLIIGKLKKPILEWLQAYPPPLLPPSLTFLGIIGFEEVNSVSEVSQHLPHLQQLEYARSLEMCQNQLHL